MALNADATINGRRLEEFLGVTRQELTASMDSKTLLAAARDEGKQFSTWIAQAKWQHLPAGLADHVCGFLQEDLVGVFTGAWTKFAELKKCARETLKDGTTMNVSLADHDFTYEMQPSVDVLLNSVKVAEIPFEIELTCEVNGLDLFLKQGCVYQVNSGKCDCTADIRCGVKVLWKRKLAGVNLPGELRLSKPIPLDASQTSEVSMDNNS
jgi:hypothetical protein